MIELNDLFIGDNPGKSARRLYDRSLFGKPVVCPHTNMPNGLPVPVRNMHPWVYSTGVRSISEQPVYEVQTSGY